MLEDGSTLACSKYLPTGGRGSEKDEGSSPSLVGASAEEEDAPAGGGSNTTIPGSSSPKAATTKPKASAPAPPSGLSSSSTRLERKRHQEKRRRVEFKEALDCLLATLLDNDSDFSREATHRENRNGDGRCDDDTALFNRVELINQSIFTIKRVVQENKDMKKAFEYYQSGRTPGLVALPTRKISVRYHQGVGPTLASTSPTVGCTGSSRSRKSQDHQAAVLAALRGQQHGASAVTIQEQNFLARAGDGPFARLSSSELAGGHFGRSQVDHERALVALLERNSAIQHQQQHQDAILLIRHHQEQAHQNESTRLIQALQQQTRHQLMAHGNLSPSPFAPGPGHADHSSLFGASAMMDPGLFSQHLAAGRSGGLLSSPGEFGLSQHDGSNASLRQSILLEELLQKRRLGEFSSLDRTLSGALPPSSVPSSSDIYIEDGNFR
jgi:hypothetical protein